MRDSEAIEGLRAPLVSERVEALLISVGDEGRNSFLEAICTEAGIDEFETLTVFDQIGENPEFIRKLRSWEIASRAMTSPAKLGKLVATLTESIVRPQP